VRFPADLAVLILAAACSCGSTSAASDASHAAPPSAAGKAVTPDEVRAAVAQLRADPNIGGEHRIRSLRWNQPSAPEPPRKPPPWIEGLFEYLGQTGSLILWVAGAIAAAIAVIWSYRTFRARTPGPGPIALPVVSRVGEMDIRPESLPEDIGAAALALADAGKTREALSLLYRGALSRAVHRFDVTIGPSDTEGEALRAVGARLDASRFSYFAELVGIWRRAVYAGETIPGDAVSRLCRRFAGALEAAA
jgi:hypothetical protein